MLRGVANLIGGGSPGTFTTLTVTGVSSFADGTVGAPSLTFTNDTDSGLYRIGANNIGIGVNGAKVLDIATTGLAVTGALSATGSVTLNTDGTFFRSGANDVATMAVGLKAFGSNIGQYAGIELQRTNVSGGTQAGEIRFFTSDMAGAGEYQQRMVVSKEGNVGIGTTSFGTNAAKVLSIANGTAPTTGPADTVQFYSSDDAAGHTVPSFFCEGTNVLATGQADSASSVRVKVRINGTVVTLLGI